MRISDQHCFSFTTYCGLSEEEAEKAIVRYRERYIPIGVYECELFEGVRETIQAFKEAGYIQVITSSKPEAQCRQVLEKFDLLTELDEVVGASHDGRIDTKIEVLQEAFLLRLRIHSLLRCSQYRLPLHHPHHNAYLRSALFVLWKNLIC